MTSSRDIGQKCMQGRVAIITGAARGIGAEHARLFAAQGAAVVLTDLAGSAAVCAEIIAGGGKALARDGDVSNATFAKALIDTAVSEFGSLDVLVNNAGQANVIRFADMTESDWDSEIHGNLKTVFAPTHAAVAYWTRAHAQGHAVRAAIINTTSGAALLGNVGQAHYGAAKAGVAALTLILAKELADIGVRVNAIAPAARTPMSEQSAVVAEFMKAPATEALFDQWHPRNIAPLVALLATADCTLTGEIFHVRGGTIARYQGWQLGEPLQSTSPWTIAELAEKIPTLIPAAAENSESNSIYSQLRNNLRDSVR